MSNQFKRKYRLTIEGPKSPVYQESNDINDEAIVIEDLRIVYKVRKSVLREPNIGEITIYNLNPETERRIIREGSIINLEAGYENNIGQIFKGNLIQPIRYKEGGTDYVLKLICIDSDAFLNLGFIEGTFSPNQTRRQLAEQIIRKSNVKLDSLDIASLPDNSIMDGSIPRTQRHKVVFGPTSKIIQDMAFMSNTSFYVDDGQGKFFNANKTPDINGIYEINSNTGMVGLPQQRIYGVDVRSLLNPGLMLNNYIKLNNSDIITEQLSIGEVPYLLDRDGLYRIIAITYEGDSRGNSWYSNLETITQVGALPTILTGPYGELLV